MIYQIVAINRRHNKLIDVLNVARGSRVTVLMGIILDKFYKQIEELSIKNLNGLPDLEEDKDHFQICYKGRNGKMYWIDIYKREIEYISA